MTRPAPRRYTATMRYLIALLADAVDGARRSAIGYQPKSEVGRLVVRTAPSSGLFAAEVRMRADFVWCALWPKASGEWWRSRRFRNL